MASSLWPFLLIDCCLHRCVGWQSSSMKISHVTERARARVCARGWTMSGRCGLAKFSDNRFWQRPCTQGRHALWTHLPPPLPPPRTSQNELSCNYPTVIAEFAIWLALFSGFGNLCVGWIPWKSGDLQKFPLKHCWWKIYTCLLVFWIHFLVA